jgi:hypothetical protein
VWTFDLDGAMWSGVNGEYRIYRHTFAGDTVRVISREYALLPVSGEERDEAIERMEWFTRQGGRIDPSRIPDRKPAFSRIDPAPDGHLWVTVTPPASETATLFDVFDPDGRYLGQVRSQASFYPRILFRGDHIYGSTADSLGVTYIVKARIVGID